MQSQYMFTNQTLPRANLLNNTDINIAETHGLEQITNIGAEKISGGAIKNPNTNANTSEKPPSSGGNIAGVPIMANPPGLGLTPFYPPLPTPKLSRLGHLKGTSHTTK